MASSGSRGSLASGVFVPLGSRLTSSPLTSRRSNRGALFSGSHQRPEDLQAQPNKPPPEHFFYFLSAFLAAARSVASILEGADKAWFGLWSDALTKLGADMRNDTVHEGRFKNITPRFEEVPIPMSYEPHQNAAVHLHVLLMRRQGEPTTMRASYDVKLQGEEREIVTVCEQHVELLERLLREFHRTLRALAKTQSDLWIGRASQAEYFDGHRSAQIYPASGMERSLRAIMDIRAQLPCYRRGLVKGQSDYQVTVAPGDPVSIIVIPSREPRLEALDQAALATSSGS